MKYSTQNVDMYSMYSPSKSPRKIDRLWISMLLISVILHGLFVLISRDWVVTDLQSAEENVETLFRVKLRDLESMNFASRPTQRQLQEERAQLLEKQIEEMSVPPNRSVDSALDETIPEANPNELPSWDENENTAPFVDDQTARDLITSNVSEQSVTQFEESALKDAISDPVNNERIALAGRGAGSGRRIMANLPQPEFDSEPAAAESIDESMGGNMAPPAPDIEISEPPIELPPVNEILPSPELMRESPGPSSLKKEEEAKQELKDRFVVLDDLVRVELFTYHHIGGDGYFMLRIRPTNQDERLRILPKDVIFVIDASRSMGNRRLGVIKDEISTLLERLRPEDRFNIVGFKQSVKRFTRTFVSATEETISQAQIFTQRLEASGKTDIYSSLSPLVQLGTARARPLVMMLYSDGRPTVGVVNSRRIINELTQFRGESSSVFCIGTGDRMNRYLLDMLAFRNRGLVAFERDRSELPALIQSVYGYIEDPVLLKVKADFNQVDETEIYPKVLPDLYLKGELKIWGRLRDEEQITVRIVGEAFDERKEMIATLPIPERDNGTFQIARDWAFHKIYHLIGKMVEVGEQPAYLDEINQLSKTYQVITPYSEEISN